MAHALDGARERLKRADENVKNLALEINPFISSLPIIPFTGDPPKFAEADRQKWGMLTSARTNIPLRWSVLAGEIVHHMRAAFDHVAWQLSSPSYRSSNTTQIEFPIYSFDPSTDKDKLRRYQGKVEGISKPSALARIESLQPYKAGNRFAHPLWLIHDLDRIDKHRELVLFVHALHTNIKIEASVPTLVIQEPFKTKPSRVIPIGIPSDYMEVKGQITGQIALDKSLTGTGQSEPVVPFLENLLRFAVNSIESFSGEFI